MNATLSTPAPSSADSSELAEPPAPAASRPRAESSPVLPAPDVAVPVPVTTTSDEDPEFSSFWKAIVAGVLLGIPILGIVVGLAVHLLAPSMEAASVIAVAVWVSLFCGPFLAGTVTVGLSSRRWH